MINVSYSNASQISCDVCHASEANKKILKCAQCHFATYCSKECQKKAWPQHKTVCLWIKELNEKCQINANPYLPNYEKVEIPKQFAIYDLSIKLLRAGYISLATEYIEKNTSTSMIRQKYFEAYAKKMFELDPNNVTIVLEKGPCLIPPGKQVLRTVIDQLCMTQHYKMAYRCATEVEDLQEQKHLLEVIGAAFQIAGEHGLANFVTQNISDDTEKKEMEEKLNQYT